MGTGTRERPDGRVDGAGDLAEAQVVDADVAGDAGAVALAVQHAADEGGVGVDGAGQADEVAGALAEDLLDDGRGVQPAGHAQREPEPAVGLGVVGQDAGLPFAGLDDPFAGLVAAGGDVQEVEVFQVRLGDDLQLLLGA